MRYICEVYVGRSFKGMWSEGFFFWSLGELRSSDFLGFIFSGKLELRFSGVCGVVVLICRRVIGGRKTFLLFRYRVVFL